MDGPGEPQGERGESDPPMTSDAADRGPCGNGTPAAAPGPVPRSGHPSGAAERDEAPGVPVPPPFRDAAPAGPTQPAEPQGEPGAADHGAAPDGAPSDGGPTDEPGADAQTDDEHAVPRQRRRLGVAAQPFGGSPSAGAAGPAAAEAGDLELVRLIRGGDALASEELYRRHVDAVRRYARSCCRDADTADDLTNEVFAATLQAIRGGAGPQTAVRAYLLTSVRRVAAAWSRTSRREQLVDDFAVFAVSAAGGSRQVEETAEAGADVRAMHVAERSMAVQAFRSLPERWQTVLWHTTVEESSPQEVAPLLGLTPNATSVLAHRAREGLKQAYLQAHVSRALTDGGGCARYADRLGAYARGGLRSRAERGLREHLRECDACSAAALEVRDLNQHIRSVLPIAVIGWFAAGSTLKGAGFWGGAAAAPET
ncbi:sigma-70 family RNA polymerase sigma factor, partial [Streptomyces bohaiensis]|uniref:sigma-70 family RNA polymerase sigma factor n=1 Tax=Streptomyces bohaiensis TaxID=1431344 RepID=UPI0030C6A02A